MISGVINKLRSVGKETLFLIVIGFAASMLLPWWVIAPIYLVMAFVLRIPAGRAWTEGFLAGSLVWGLWANHLDTANASMLSEKIGTLFMGIKPAHLLWATASLGGLLGGFAAMAGGAMRDMTSKAPNMHNQSEQ